MKELRKFFWIHKWGIQNICIGAYNMKSFGIDMDFFDEDEFFSLSLSFWFTVYISIDVDFKIIKWFDQRWPLLIDGYKLPKNDIEYGSSGGRELGFRIYSDGSFHADLWSYAMDGRRRTWYVDLKRLILGDYVTHKTQLEEGVCNVPMPEGDYPAIFKRWRGISYRKRLPFLKRKWYRTEIEVGGGIPKPGKGENSWDCGDDATFAITFAQEKTQSSIYQFCKQYAMSVLEDRSSRESLSYKPQDGFERYIEKSQQVVDEYLKDNPNAERK